MSGFNNSRPRIAFIHTVAGLIDMFRALAEAELEADIFHILNESLLHDLLRDGPSQATTRRIVQQALLAADAGADLVVFTCSSTSPAIDVAREMTAVPIIKIDDPLMTEAVKVGSRIAVLCTTKSTVGPSTELLRDKAATQGGKVQIETRLVEGAFDALKRGQRDVHDEMVSAAAHEISVDADVLVLAQASLARLREPLAADLPIPVLASPQLLIASLRRKLAESNL